MSKYSSEERIHSLIEAVMQVARGDYSVQIPLSEENDELDALALGLNMLIDDLAENLDLQKQNDRMKVINTELEQAKLKAEESDRLKSAFLANMSHEIRTPMNAIMGFSSLLETPNLDRQSMLEYVRIIKSSGEHLIGLINDILDLAKIESNQLQLHKQYISYERVMDEINDMIRQHQLWDKKPDLEFFFEKAPGIASHSLFTDEIRFKQILLNLLTNAIKYTNTGFVKLKAELSKNGEKLFAEISVEDSGIGIPEKNHHEIYNRFVRLQNDGFYEGTGIGLSITKGLVDLLEGEIKLSSVEGKGTIFKVILPCTEEMIFEKQSPSFSLDKLDLDLSTQCIYIAEDNYESFILIKEIIEHKGGKVFHAQNGKELLELVNKKKPDLVLLDISMPVMDGYETIKQLRQLNLSFPVIAQTAYASKEDRLKILNAGFDGYLSKPISPYTLIEELILHLKQNNIKN